MSPPRELQDRHPDPRQEGFDNPLVQDLMLAPTKWRLWPAVAILRWLQRQATESVRIVYRTHPSLSFPPSEIRDLGLRTPDKIELILNAPGFATAGTALPAADIARIIADHRAGGAINTWLDGITDVFFRAVEDLVVRAHAPFSLAMGAPLDGHRFAAEFSGRSAPLSARPGAILAMVEEDPDGALGFARMFVGPASASGLAALVSAFTSLPVRIEEFAGAEIRILRPLRIGRTLGTGLVGTVCNLPSAGIVVHIDGGSEPNSPIWILDPTRRRSLHRLARAYIGSATPEARIVLWLDPENVPSAMLGATSSTFGGLPVLGGASTRRAYSIGG